MNYNDSKLANDTECLKIKRNFDSIKSLENDDLNEIYTKLHNQYNNLQELNKNGEYSELLNKTKNNLDELSRLLKNNIVYTNQSPNNNTYGKIPSMAEMNAHNNSADNNSITPIPQTPSNSNSDNFDTAVPAPNVPNNFNQQPSTQRRTNRQSPLQSNILSSILKGISIKSKKVNPLALNDRNKFHRDCPNNYCNPKRKFVTNQLDLIRLLLIFMSLRPTCHYHQCLCRISNDQFSVLSAML